MNPLDPNNPFDASRNDQFIEEFRSGVGPVKDAFPIPEASFLAMALRFPATIQQLWREDGLGSLYKGQAWLCDPVEFAPVVRVLFAGDPDLKPERTHIYAYTVFGIAIFWNEDFNSGEVDLVRGIAKCNGLTSGKQRENVYLDSLMALETFKYDAHGADDQDENDKWMFARAKKALGPAAYGECYGYFPALALGGARLVETMRRVQAVEHFAMLAQMQPFMLRDLAARPIRDVRLIGGA